MISAGKPSMPLWTCPNPKCIYDKRLEPDQLCPVCGQVAAPFNSEQFGLILKQKWNHKKDLDRAKQQKQILSKTKFCPKCGSANLTVLIFYRPSTWRCLNCGYEGALIIEDGKLAKKIQEEYREKRQQPASEQNEEQEGEKVED
jgi:RNA polymerase subunit RPABC4/transcription elongation factor Spt4